MTVWCPASTDVINDFKPKVSALNFLLLFVCLSTFLAVCQPSWKIQTEYSTPSAL